MFPSQKYRAAVPGALASARFNGAGMFLSRKSSRGLPIRRASCGLQWGRDVSIPEITAATPIAPYFRTLQWGRDVSIPEITVCFCPFVFLFGFNGAGMFLSRKWRRSEEH